MHDFDANAYGPVFAKLLETDRNRPLDAGQPSHDRHSELNALSTERAFDHEEITDRIMAATCVSAVWLLHDFLDESHTISQGIKTAEGSFWHGIMHRREGDFSNAKYWFRNIGEHAIFEELSTVASGLATQHETAAATEIADSTAWDPYAFVDLCQSAIERNTDDESLLRAVQLAEWEILFDFCYRAAVA